MKNILISILISTLFISCNKDPIPTQIEDYVMGKNQFFTTVDGNAREYYVHVPERYDKNAKNPVVFVLHGTGGNGLKFYNTSGWNALADSVSLITVHPSSGKYCILDDGQTKNTTKWNVYAGSYSYCPEVLPMDDIKFFRQIVTELNQKFSVDSHKTYLAGFSNGGEMAFRCSVEMGDVFAAIVESAGSFSAFDTTFVPIRKEIPITIQLGNQDQALLGSAVNFPLSEFDSLINNFPFAQQAIYVNRTTFGFDSTYTISGTTNTAMVATFNSNPFQNNRVLNFVLVNGLAHNYPNGINHSAKGSAINWEWMKQYTLP